MIMTKEIAKAILEEDNHDFADVTGDTLYDRSRWSVCYERVVHHTETDTYWLLTWSRGATEYQDEGIEDVSYCKVKPVTKTVVEYEHD